MIYTLTLNPAIDYTVGVENFVEGKTNRTSFEKISFGGKGINLSVMLKNLGCDSVALGFVAGFTGDALCSALSNMGLRTDFIRLDKGVTRINVKLKSELESEINAQGPEVSQDDIQKLFLKLDMLCERDILVLSGSIPNSLPPDIYSKIMERLDKLGVRIILDCSGEALIRALEQKPFLIKPNLSELEEAVRRKLESIEDIFDAAESVRRLGAQRVIVSLGSDGAVFVDEHGERYIQKAPKTEPISTVGAGDSLLAAFIYSMSDGYLHALKLGVAAGSATASVDGIADADTVSRMLSKIPT